MTTCRHCHRTIVADGDLWVDPEATGDDAVWRETCDEHDTFEADHEPETGRATALDEQERADAIGGYLECAGWLVNDHEGATEEERERGYDGDHRGGPFTEDAREHASNALDELVDALDDPEDVRAYVDRAGDPRGEYSAAGLLGHDLWLTRNGHGAGFWDRGLGALGDRLSEAARSLGEAYAIVLDDGEETVDIWG